MLCSRRHFSCKNLGDEMASFYMRPRGAGRSRFRISQNTRRAIKTFCTKHGQPRSATMKDFYMRGCVLKEICVILLDLIRST